MSFDRPRNAMLKLIRDLEVPIVYGMTAIAIFVSLFVYGATLLRSDGGLLDFLKPIFGLPYSLIFLFLLLAVLVNSRRWKGVLLVVVAYILMLMISFSSTRSDPDWLTEYLVLSVTMALLFVTAGLHHELLDND